MLQGVSEGEKQRLMVALEEMQMKEQVCPGSCVQGHVYAPCLCVRACARACVPACARACVRACVRVRFECQ
jgi:hypothetical protein